MCIVNGIHAMGTMSGLMNSNLYGYAERGQIIRGRVMAYVQLPKSELGHSRSTPADIGTPIISPRFRAPRTGEMPVDGTVTVSPMAPQREPIPDPTLE